MGAVIVRHEFVVMDRGYPCGNYKIYRYCDSCGSFHITARFLKKNLQIMLTIAALLGLLFILFNEMFWPGVIIFFSLGIFFPWMDYLFSVECGKCGKKDFCNYNLLHFKPYDPSILDVPENMTSSIEYFGIEDDFEQYL